MKTLMLVFVLLFALVLPSFAQSTPTGNLLTFSSQSNSFGVGSTGNVFSLCGTVTGILVNSTQNIDHTKTTVLKFRLGTGFGTLNSASNLRVEHYPNTAAAANPISSGDFTLTTSGQNVIITYNQSVDEQFAFRDTICVDPNWDAAGSATDAVVGLDLTLNSSISPQTQGILFFVR